MKKPKFKNPFKRKVKVKMIIKKGEKRYCRDCKYDNNYEGDRCMYGVKDDGKKDYESLHTYAGRYTSDNERYKYKSNRNRSGSCRYFLEK